MRAPIGMLIGVLIGVFVDIDRLVDVNSDMTRPLIPAEWGPRADPFIMPLAG